MVGVAEQASVIDVADGTAGVVGDACSTSGAFCLWSSGRLVCPIAMCSPGTRRRRTRGSVLTRLGSLRSNARPNLSAGANHVS